MASNDSSKTVFLAFSVNFFIAGIKTVIAILTSSSAMFSEAVHSYVDSGNQFLLWFGIKQSKKPNKLIYPLGRGKEEYFWTLVVAVLIFTIGGLVSLEHGKTIEDAKAADPALVDYIGISPVFPTPTKSDFNAYIGLDGISDIANATSLPSVAIGGLKREHCGKIFSTGCQGMAVVSAICGKDDPYMETKLLHDEIRRVFEDNKPVN